MNKHQKRQMKRNTKDNIQYYIMLIVPLLWILVFCYLPMFGIVIAFQDYSAGRPFFGEGVKWVGLRWFKEFLGSYYFPRILRNTLRLSLMGFFLGFLAPILFALLVNEILIKKYKNFVQTCSYLPYFLSGVVVAGIVRSLIADDGIIPSILAMFGREVKSLNIKAELFPWIYTITNIWKGFGWSSIIYLSTISAIDPQLYEAAAVDGAGRLKRIWHVTLPGMAPLIVIKLIMEIGGILGANSELILLLYNPSVFETADVIGTYVYRENLMTGRYSPGAANGLLMSIIGLALTLIANKICRKYTDYSLW